FTLRFAGDGAEKATGGFLKSLDGAVRKRVAFLAPTLPADVARHVLGVEFQPIQDDARGFHDIVANHVTGHPRSFVFRHAQFLPSRFRLITGGMTKSE